LEGVIKETMNTELDGYAELFKDYRETLMAEIRKFPFSFEGALG